MTLEEEQRPNLFHGSTMNPPNTDSKPASGQGLATDTTRNNAAPIVSSNTGPLAQFFSTDSPPEYVVYKRRFFSLMHLILLNVMASWCWLTFASIPSTSTNFFDKSQAMINWLSISFLFAFVAASPFTVLVLNRGVKPAIITASAFLLVGNWVRYAGTRAGSDKYSTVLAGQVIVGFAQPFVLAAATRHSDMWFTAKDRITATAMITLASPFGAALGQIISPIWINDPAEMPNMVLCIALFTTVLTLPGPFLPSAPKTPPTSTSVSAVPLKLTWGSINSALASASFQLLVWPFAIYVSALNATSALISRILVPYGFSEVNAGTAGAILFLVGLVTAAVSSPLLGRYPDPVARLATVKVLAVVIVAMYFWLPWAVGGSSTAETPKYSQTYVVLAILGAANFALLPLALELLVEYTWPVGPEVSSIIAWAMGQVGSGVFICTIPLVNTDWFESEPFNSLFYGLFLVQAISALIAMVMATCCLGRGKTGGVELRAQREKENAGRT